LAVNMSSAMSARLRGQRILSFFNFSEKAQTISENIFRVYGLGYGFHDLMREQPFEARDVRLGPYECLFFLRLMFE
jgi:hypothetical protein